MIRKGVIDFTAFLSKDRQVIIKELSVIDIESKCVQHWIFEPPQDQLQMQCSANNFTFDYHNKWMSTHFHGLYYMHGSTAYKNLTSVLMQICRDVHVLFATTTEKAKVLEEIFNYDRAVVSLELLGCPSLPRDPLLELGDGQNNENARVQLLGKSCLFHNIYAPGFYCTQRAVQGIAEWCESNLDKIDLNNPEIREKTYVNWKQTLPSAKDLSENGFIRMCSTNDNTKCIYCGVVLMSWEETDVPALEHEQHSPFCRFIRFKAQSQEEERKKAKFACDEKKVNKEFEDGRDDCGRDECGCFEFPKMSENELHNLCYV